MNSYRNDEVKRDMCKNHSARTEKDLYRVCPSKLSKKELEDLYFSLLEKNLELKKTVTGQQDQIKVLSTKVQRMTATQRNNVAKEKDCCMYTKAMVNDQKESIADLKRTNEKMAERIRVLNMRLCSAKQFLRRSPATSTSRCPKCCPPPMSLKNSSVTVLHAKMSESNVKTAVSNNGVERDIMLSTRTVETETEEPEKENPESICNENRCRSQLEELKQKIVDLQEELSITHTDYSRRITHLETEVNELRSANDRERMRRASSDDQVQMRGEQLDQLAARLRESDAKLGELAAELTIEKNKVAELETRLRAAERASSVVKSLQEQLDSANQLVNDMENQQLETSVSPYFSPRWDKSSSPRLEVPVETPGQPSEATDKPAADKDESTEKARHSKLSNDSGYIEAYKSPKVEEVVKLNVDSNQEIKNRITHLQHQMNQLLFVLKTGAPAPCDINLSKSDESKPLAETCGETSKEKDSYPTAQTVSAIKASKIAVSQAYAGRTTETVKKEKDETESVNTTLQKTAINTPANVELVIDNAPVLVKKGPPPSSDATDEIKDQAKRDSHNRLQIPGPMPVDMPTIPETIDSSKKKPKVKNKTGKFKTISKESVIRAREINKLTGIDYKKRYADVPVDETETNAELKQSTDNTGHFEVERETKVRLSDSKDVSGVTEQRVSKSSLTETFQNESDMAANMSTFIPAENDQGVEADGRIELCLHHTRICTCGGARRRDVAVFRTCSGALRFRTAPAPGFKRCACAGPPAADKRDQETQTSDSPEPQPFRERSATYSKGQTYPVPPKSPDNTEHEISSLSDLPSEKDGKSPRSALSPGEEKATTTYTDTSTPYTTTEYNSLSEGELPGAGTARKLSDGEAKFESQNKKQLNASGRQSARMEEALSAISEELALCRNLLNARASEGKGSKDAAQTADLCPGAIALKKASGTPRIGDAFSPKCIFTMHIGTVVLSDEAVINSRDMSLVLTWKFYDQNVTMTRMRTGRVVLFDFSTEYDVKITDHFLDYLKFDNMQIIISELDQQDVPFASCALPLRDALLHTNRRADMSLALVAGPNLRQTHDALDSGDEVGVLDLWCMLRVDPALLPAINRAIARSTPPNLKENAQATCISQMMEDDRYHDDRISQDLDMRPATQPKVDTIEFEPPSGLTVKEIKDLYDARRHMPQRQRSSAGSPSRAQDAAQPSAPPGPEIRHSVESQTYSPTSAKPAVQKLGRTSSLQRGAVGFKNARPDVTTNSHESNIIANEVPANIKSPSDMIQALDRNAIHDHNVPPVTRLGKLEEDAVSQTQSNVSSWRGLVTRRQIPKCIKHSFCKSSITCLLKKDRSLSSKRANGSPDVPVRKAHPSEEIEEPPELSKSHRIINTSKKSVTIAKYTDNTERDTWEKDNNKVFPEYDREPSVDNIGQCIEITVMWLALNEECDAMLDPAVQRLYVAYTFLGRGGAELETPVSLPKPQSYVDKCYFQFVKKFQLSECDQPLLGHMARCRSKNRTEHSSKDCIIFTVISEPPEDPLGLDSCVDIGHAYLYLGDVLACAADSGSYVEVVPVQARARDAVCGVLAVKVEGLDVVRRCASQLASQKDTDSNTY